MKKTALVTGASQGIGKAIAQAFALAGYQVILHYHIHQEAAIQAAQQLCQQGFLASTVKADISQRKEVEAMISAVLTQYGQIDVLVNNAGIAAQQLFSDITEEDWNRMMGVNVNGMFHCCQCVLPDMIRRKCGSIINISSIWGLVGASCEVHYSTAKAAIIGFTKALAKEVGPSQIRVNCIAPGVINTDMNRNLDEETVKGLIDETPLCRIGQPQDIADVAVFLAGEHASFITGQVISPNGGFII